MPTFENPPIAPESSKLEQFIESQREKIEQAHAIFHGEDYREFLELNEILNSLLEDYQKLMSAEGKFLTTLPNEVFERVIGQDYVLQKESDLKLEGQRSGIYLPADEHGGGDYLARAERGGRVGQVELLDFMGHGEKALWPKALILRMIDLGQAAGELPPEELFADLDLYVGNLPFRLKSLDLLSVELKQESDGRPELKVEVAGGPRLFIRHQDGVVELPAFDNYPPLGYKNMAGEERKVNILPVAEGDDVFLSSDGLFDIRINAKGHERFSEIFSQFCVERKTLSGEEFKQALINYIKQAKQEDRADDDITVLALKVENGKFV